MSLCLAWPSHSCLCRVNSRSFSVYFLPLRASQTNFNMLIHILGSSSLAEISDMKNRLKCIFVTISLSGIFHNSLSLVFFLATKIGGKGFHRRMINLFLIVRYCPCSWCLSAFPFASNNQCKWGAVWLSSGERTMSWSAFKMCQHDWQLTIENMPFIIGKDTQQVGDCQMFDSVSHTHLCTRTHQYYHICLHQCRYMNENILFEKYEGLFICIFFMKQSIMSVQRI